MTRTTALESQQCSARSSRTGERCRRRVIGATVCIMHGGKSPQVARKRLERIALAEAAARTPRRHPGEVLLDALHWADTHARQLAESTDNSADSEKLLGELERAARLAETALRLDTEQRSQNVIEREGEHVYAVLDAIFRGVLTDLVQALSVHHPGSLAVVEREWERIVNTHASRELGAMHERASRELEADRG
jgi:hypothetical protein